eukprot:284743_1
MKKTSQSHEPIIGNVNGLEVAVIGIIMITLFLINVYSYCKRYFVNLNKISSTTDQQSQQPTTVCSMCESPTSFLCSRCKSIYYCNSQCQRDDWQRHKKECKKSNHIHQPSQHKENNNAVNSMKDMESKPIMNDIESEEDSFLTSDQPNFPWARKIMELKYQLTPHMELQSLTNHLKLVNNFGTLVLGYIISSILAPNKNYNYREIKLNLLKQLKKELKKHNSKICINILSECGFEKEHEQMVFRNGKNDINLIVLEYVWSVLMYRVSMLSTFQIYDFPQTVFGSIQIGQTKIIERDKTSNDVDVKHHEVDPKLLKKQNYIFNSQFKDSMGGTYYDGISSSMLVKFPNGKHFTYKTQNKPNYDHTYNQYHMMQNQEAMIPELVCDMKLKKCSQFKRLKKVTDEFKNNKHVDNNDLQLIYDDFFHLKDLHSHQFEKIYNHFGGKCNAEQCSMFQRHNCRNRQSEIHEQKQIDNIADQIIDMIHCYYSHSFDIGNKLTNSEKKLMAKSEKKDRIKIMCEILKPKNRRYHNMRKRHFHKLMTTSEIINDEQKEEYPLYSFGVQYFYQTEEKHMFMMSMDSDTGMPYFNKAVETSNTCYFVTHIIVNKKYKDLKRELLNNPVFHVTKPDFNIEYKKAGILHASGYCKRYVGKIRSQTQHNGSKDTDKFTIEHLLSLMAHSNYDGLCYAINNTYRKQSKEETYSQIGERHRNFYWCGKLMAESIKQFGMSTSHSNVQHFYHGVSNQVLFPELFGGRKKTVHEIYCPLSTTSEIEVAINFTDHNTGLIVDFGTGGGARNMYFDVSWLSNYANEKEYLFVQSGENLEISTIIVPQFINLGFQSVLDTLKQKPKETET